MAASLSGHSLWRLDWAGQHYTLIWIGALLVYYCEMKREILGFPRPVPRGSLRGGHPEGIPKGP
jgi:hypothetical protein